MTINRSFNARLVLFGALAVAAQAAAAENWSGLDPEKSADPLAACTLVTPHQSMDDSQGQTEVWLEINPKALTVKTKSDIDTAFNDIALKVDDKQPIAFDEVDNKTNVVFSKAIDAITGQFITGLNVRVQLRFWPTWPSTGLKTVDFSLIGFTKAHEGLAGCGTMPPKEGQNETGNKI
jgi:hypothetical protein